MSMLVRTLTTAALGATAACATTSPGSRPDDMSAAEHHRTAQVHEQEAAQHQAQYDPRAHETRIRGHAAGAAHGEADTGHTVTQYNPTKSHLGHAAVHREHAAQHERAARTLETFEEAECGRFPAEVRVACPLLGQVSRLENIEGGVRMILAPDVSTAAVIDHMRCHYAHARKIGREGMGACPLYLEGIRIESAADGAIEILADDPATVEAIRARSAAHVTP